MNVKDMLQELEGRKPCAYQDNLGFWTIGVGRLIDARKPGAGLSEDEIDYLLNNDIQRKTAEVTKALPWLAALNEPRQAVILGMAFQMGTQGLLGFRNTLAAVQSGRWMEAKTGMLNSLWAKQTPDRAARMARQMETGEWQ